MKKSLYQSMFKNGLILLFITFFFTSNAQSFIKVLEAEYNLSEITKVGDEYLMISSSGSIWRSMDGVNWEEDVIDEFTDVDAHGYLASIAFFDDKNGIAASSSNPDLSKSSLYHTDDGGYTWVRSKLKLEDGSELSISPFRLFALDAETVVMTQRYTNKLLLSHDRGATWTFFLGYTQTGGALTDIRFMNKDVWLLPTDDGLYKTTNQLETTELLIDENFIEFYASPDSPKMYGVKYYFGGSYELFFSDDEFETWTVTSLNEVIPDIGFVALILEACNILYIFEGSKMHYSIDDGQTWTETDLENPDYFNLKVTKIGDEIYSHRGSMLKYDCMDSGIKESNSEVVIGAYPNPSSGTLTFSNPNNLDLSYSLFDMSGRKLKEDKCNGHVDISEFENGLYFMHILNPENNKSTIERIVLIK